MPRFLNTIVGGSAGIAICGRCKRKRPYAMLTSDPNNPGLRVCSDKPGCKDQRDPYRDAPRPMEQIALQYPRPDAPLDLPKPMRVTQDGGIRIISTAQIRKPT